MPKTEYCDVSNNHGTDLNVIFSHPENEKLHLTGEPQLVFHSRNHYIFKNTHIYVQYIVYAMLSLVKCICIFEKWLRNSIINHCPNQQNYVQSTLHLGPDHSVWVYFVKMNVYCRLYLANVQIALSGGHYSNIPFLSTTGALQQVQAEKSAMPESQLQNLHSRNAYWQHDVSRGGNLWFTCSVVNLNQLPVGMSRTATVNYDDLKHRQGRLNVSKHFPVA